MRGDQPVDRGVEADCMSECNVCAFGYQHHQLMTYLEFIWTYLDSSCFFVTPSSQAFDQEKAWCQSIPEQAWSIDPMKHSHEILPLTVTSLFRVCCELRQQYLHLIPTQHFSWEIEAVWLKICVSNLWECYDIYVIFWVRKIYIFLLLPKFISISNILGILLIW